MHWIGAQFGVCMSLEFRDMSLSILKFCLNDHRKIKNKQKTKTVSLFRNPLTINKMQIWPGNKLKKILINSL